MAKTVLILSGDPAESDRLSAVAAKLGLSALVLPGVEALQEGCSDKTPGLVILDNSAGGPDGGARLRRVRSAFAAPVIVLTGPDDPEEAEAARGGGARAILARPFRPDEAEQAMGALLHDNAVDAELAKLRSRADDEHDFSGLVAVAPEMQRALAQARRAADFELPVLFEGEPGTGKRLLAKSIHAASARGGRPLNVVRFDAASRERIAAGEIDAAEIMQKAWSEARGGTLFLEEISDLPPICQDRLNHDLVEQVRNGDDIGGTVRLMCSSSKNLIEQVKKGALREDLYFRINVFPIWLPPLRDRKDDIPDLARHFLRQIIVEEGKPIEEIDGAAMALLKAYVWPGNVRQLENAVFRAVALAEGHRLTMREFPQIAAQVPGFQPNAPAETPIPQPPRYEGPAMIGSNLPNTRAITLTPYPNTTTIGIPALTEDGEVRRLEDIEADLIRLALGHYRGHITEVAKRLGIGRSTLYRKMREFGLTVRHN